MSQLDIEIAKLETELSILNDPELILDRIKLIEDTLAVLRTWKAGEE